MIESLALIIIIGLAMAGICKLLRLPRIIGMLVTGIVLGPCCLDALDGNLLAISGELRTIALIIILIKAGLSLKLSDLKKVGRPAIMLSFVPALFEILAFGLLGPLLLPISMIEGFLMGAVLGAVSPAVVIPRMSKLMDEGYGMKKAIPQMIVAGSSVDDIFVIVLFNSFLGMADGEKVNPMDFVNIPVSIILGIALGVIMGLVLVKMFDMFYKKNKLIRNSMKVIIIVGVSFLMMGFEYAMEPYFAVSGLLAILSMAVVIAMKSEKKVTERLSQKFNKLWLMAEIILFVLVGAAVDIEYTMKAGGMAVLMIFIALIVRSLGTMICLIGTKLNMKERIYTVLSYIPKATVQAAIGSVALNMGLPCGEIVLSVAVLSIIITAPLGAFAMDLTYKKLLHKDVEESHVTADNVQENTPALALSTANSTTPFTYMDDSIESNTPMKEQTVDDILPNTEENVDKVTDEDNVYNEDTNNNSSIENEESSNPIAKEFVMDDDDEENND